MTTAAPTARDFPPHNGLTTAHNNGLAETIASARGLPAVRDALVAALDASASGLTPEQVSEVARALAEPVAYALTKSRDRGIRYGDRSARQAVANRLGLGDLV